MEEDTASERLGNLCKVTQLASSSASLIFPQMPLCTVLWGRGGIMNVAQSQLQSRTPPSEGVVHPWPRREWVAREGG